MVVANQPDIMVVDKRDEKAVGVGVAIPSESNFSKKEHTKVEKIPKVERGVGNNVVSRGISGTNGDRITRGCNSQVG